MLGDGNKGSPASNPIVTPENSQRSFSLHQRGEGEKGQMETEGRGFSDLYRNTSEEMFLKSLMESSIGMPVPSMEMLGFKNLSQPFRTDSEELFKSWLTNGETHGYNSSSIAHRTRQASRRMSTELANLPAQQQGSIPQGKSSDVSSAQNTTTMADDPSDPNHQSMRNAVERNMQASNLYLAKAWFHSSQPMTRSRSSELRRRYAAMQNSQTILGMEAMQNVSEHSMANFKQEVANPNGFNNLPINDVANQLGSFISPSNSSSSTFNAPQMGNVDQVSSVVNMLKGTLERRKLANQVEKETVEDSAAAIYNAQESIVNSGFNEAKENNFLGIPLAFQQVSPAQVKDPGALQAMQDQVVLELEGFINSMNPVQLNAVSREPSQSESSAAAPVVSSGFDVCDGPSNSSQNFSFAESSRKPVGTRASESVSRARDIRVRIIDNLKDDRKRGGLVRYGSVNSAASEVIAVDKGDPTKKRRVERSRKMAEAKERSLSPAIPSDMQSVLKRCENLEKEVRSLKLNLSFMNRKDSEQTKQIEELQKKNDELTDEKERLLEEIERILSETGKM